jgi:hypothetical protein
VMSSQQDRAAIVTYRIFVDELLLDATVTT